MFPFRFRRLEILPALFALISTFLQMSFLVFAERIAFGEDFSTLTGQHIFQCVNSAGEKLFFYPETN